MAKADIQRFIASRQATLEEMNETPASREYNEILQATNAQSLDNSLSYSPSTPTPTSTRLGRGSSYSSDD